ncbi:hypothetical protein U9M48_044951 [Paspalum notatum var. saurae]|uniref:Isopenicillin N synthase-like Fe(2+) 2OG dioxygenase domain-containing protein n=1 Tax=Paspalum notatum var. saurae TaxID=547442 RepID=A0AAQ3XI09_PASNO
MLVGVCAFFVSMTGGIQTEKTFRYRLHQDTNLLSVVCQHEVEGLEMQTRNDKWVLIKPSPTSLVSWSAMPWVGKTSSASVFLKKVLARKTNSRLTVEYDLIKYVTVQAMNLVTLFNIFEKLFFSEKNIPKMQSLEYLNVKLDLYTGTFIADQRRHWVQFPVV